MGACDIVKIVGRLVCPLSCRGNLELIMARAHSAPVIKLPSVNLSISQISFLPLLLGGLANCKVS